MSALPPKADIHRRERHVGRLRSMTLSARESNVAGTSMPSDLAVCRLMTNSNLVDCATGKSAGLAPLRILAGLNTSSPPSIQKVRCIAHKTVDCHGRAPGVNHWHAIPSSQRDDLIGIGKKRNIMGSGRLSVLSAYGYARHERTSAPAQANTPLVAERRVEYAQHY